MGTPLRQPRERALGVAEGFGGTDVEPVAVVAEAVRAAQGLGAVVEEVERERARRGGGEQAGVEDLRAGEHVGGGRRELPDFYFRRKSILRFMVACFRFTFCESKCHLIAILA